MLRCQLATGPCRSRAPWDSATSSGHGSWWAWSWRRRSSAWRRAPPASRCSRTGRGAWTRPSASAWHAPPDGALRAQRTRTRAPGGGGLAGPRGGDGPARPGECRAHGGRPPSPAEGRVPPYDRRCLGRRRRGPWGDQRLPGGHQRDTVETLSVEPGTGCCTAPALGDPIIAVRGRVLPPGLFPRVSTCGEFWPLCRSWGRLELDGCKQRSTTSTAGSHGVDLDAQNRTRGL